MTWQHPQISEAERIFAAGKKRGLLAIFANLAEFIQKLYARLPDASFLDRLRAQDCLDLARKTAEVAEKLADLRLKIARIEYLDRLRSVDWLAGDGALRP